MQRHGRRYFTYVILVLVNIKNLVLAYELFGQDSRFKYMYSSSKLHDLYSFSFLATIGFSRGTENSVTELAAWSELTKKHIHMKLFQFIRYFLLQACIKHYWIYLAVHHSACILTSNTMGQIQVIYYADNVVHHWLCLLPW